MRSAVNIVFTLAAFSAAAFDSQEWLGKRELLAREAERLQRAYADALKRIDSPAENITVPVESFPDGGIKTSVFARKAQFFLDTGLIWGEGVTVRTLDDDGSEAARVEAGSCIVDRGDEARSGWVEGRARAVHGKMSLEGEGVYMSFAEEYVSISSNAVVVADELKLGSVSGGGKGSRTVLRSRRADYDRAEGVIMFEGGVRLENPEYKLVADRVFAFVRGTNELRRIVAAGNVAVTNGLRSGYCDRTTYSRADSRLVMYAGEKTPAKLVDMDDGRRREIEGDRITFYLDSEQVEVERPRMTVETGKEEFRL